MDLLKEADIVVTNPPFSLFREYVAQLIEYDKKFIIVGHQNAISYKEIFKLMKENKVWLGYGFKGGAAHFINTQYEDYATAGNHKDGMIRVSGVHWFTNLDISKRHEDLILYKPYTTEEYPTYENFNAINVNKTKDIPINYKGFMGVPITFLDKYNPDQFELIGLGISNSGIEIGVKPYKPEHKKFRKEVQKRGAVNGDLYMMENGEVKVPYARVIIKNKKN
ncbi:adenine-specific methyltransferase EcoRI family protein [Flavobacteriaceae bacterium]|nr:adenine-specific methyltransferase EcoRI family protein [Flavobacteriaceae bacterium]